jgi:hypothetical protein
MLWCLARLRLGHIPPILAGFLAGTESVDMDTYFSMMMDELDV